MKIKKRLFLGIVSILIFWNGSCPCCAKPLFFNYKRDYVIDLYFLTTDSLFTEKVAVQDPKEKYALNLTVKGDLIGRLDLIFFFADLEGYNIYYFDNNFVYGSSDYFLQVGDVKTQSTNNQVSYDSVVSKFKQLAHEYGDTIAYGKVIEKVAPTGNRLITAIKDPVVRIDIESTQDYRQGKDVNSFSHISYEAFERNIAWYLNRENMNSKMIEDIGIVYEFKSGKEPTVSSKDKDLISFNNRTNIEDYPFSGGPNSSYIEFHQFRLSLISPPYKSGNYEFEITATTKSGKVLKTKTAPVYLVGENE